MDQALHAGLKLDEGAIVSDVGDRALEPRAYWVLGGDALPRIGFELLDAPVRRVAAACVPLPFADVLEQQVIPTVDTVTAAVTELAAY